MDTFKTIMKEQIIEILDIDNVIDACFKKMDEKHKEELDADGAYAQIGTWIIIDLLGPSEIGRYTGDEGEYAIGISVLIQIWELIDIGMETKRYNHNLYREIFGKEPPSFSLNLQPTYQGANLTLAYKFD